MGDKNFAKREMQNHLRTQCVVSLPAMEIWEMATGTRSGQITFFANLRFYFFVNKFLSCNVFCKFARILPFICLNMKEYRKENIQRLALKLAGHPDAAFILRQVEGWQKLSVKVPSWAAVDDLHYPHRLALEQCSGEAAATYKAKLIQRLFPTGGRLMIDLTGGLGVDFSFMARHFERAIYVERQQALCELAQHNFPLLGLHHADVVHADLSDVLPTLPNADLIFVDPARRDASGGKVFCLEDCEPNMVELLPKLLGLAPVVVIKLSTMLDLNRALQSLLGVTEVHVFAEHGECKDLLLVVERQQNQTQEPRVYCADDSGEFVFTQSEESEAQPEYAQDIEKYLYEPSAAILKAGAFKRVAVHFSLKKLHSNSHLYTSDVLAEHFPGRCFQVGRICCFNKKELKTFVGGTKKANLTVRNFPSTVADLRKRLKLAEGGDEYWFATTMNDGSHVLIATTKV